MLSLGVGGIALHSSCTLDLSDPPLLLDCPHESLQFSSSTHDIYRDHSFSPPLVQAYHAFLNVFVVIH